MKVIKNKDVIKLVELSQVPKGTAFRRTGDSRIYMRLYAAGDDEGSVDYHPSKTYAADLDIGTIMLFPDDEPVQIMDSEVRVW